MTTVSVPINPELEAALQYLQAETGASRAGVIRKAIEKYHEDEMVNAVLESQRQVAEGKVIRGDWRQLLAD
jgi:predicted DNA-binding protein